MQTYVEVVGAILVAVISYFLKKTMDDLKETAKLSVENKSEISILKTDYKNKIDFFTEKFDELKITISELIKEIKELNKRI